MQKLHSGLIFAIFIILLVSPLQSQVLAVPASDTGGPPTVILGPFAPGVPIVLTVEYNPIFGPIQKQFPNFPQGPGFGPQPIIEVITVGPGSPDITDWHEEGGRIGSGNQIANDLLWISAKITLADGETCTVAEPNLINTCGNITIERDTSGLFDPVGNPIYDLVWFDFPNNPQSNNGGINPDTFIIEKLAFWPFTVAGARITLGVNEFPTAQPPSFCGDGTIDAGEACDDGGANGSTTCGCSAVCTFPTVLCRPGSGDLCDPDEICDGAGSCPADTFAPGTLVCNPGSGDVCDPDELCPGTAGGACPVDTFAPSTLVCNPGSGDVCDPDELCLGTADFACPADSITSVGTVCNASVGTCDPSEVCSGIANQACPVDVFASSSTVCRADSGQCDVAESCTGTSGICPADAKEPNGTSCDDGEFCTLGEQCTSGACGGGTANPDQTCSPGGGGPRVGGEYSTIDSTTLLVSGMQSSLSWMIPVAVSMVGVTVILVRWKF